MPYIDLGPAPSEDSPVQGTGFVDLGPAPSSNILAQQQQERPAIIGQALEATQRPGSRLADMPVHPPGYQPDPDSLEPLVTPDPTKEFMDRVEFIYKDPQLNLENKKSLIEEQITKRQKERAGEIIGGVQGRFEQEKLQEELGGKFGKKALRRFQRGGVNVAGGLADFAGQITKLATLGKYGDGPADWARLAHDALKAPEFRALEENTFDKFFGAAVETAPFMLTAASGAILSGGAAIPSFITSFVVSYAVEGNGAYQTALDRGLSEREARLRGVVVGLVNAGIEVGIGGGAKYFKADVAAATMLSKLRRAGKFTKRFVKNALAEGLEEGLQEISSTVLGGDVPTDEGGNLDFNAAAGRIVDAWVAGTILGGAFEGLQISKQAVQKYTAQKKGAVRKMEAAQTTVEDRAVPSEEETTAILEKTPLIVEAPTTADQAIGQQYGLTNKMTDDMLSNAEQRYLDLKHMDTDKRTETDRQELAFLRRNRGNVEALLDRETEPTAPRIQKPNKKTLMAVGHKIQREYKVSDADYRDLAKKTTDGKSSMKDMDNTERAAFVAALEDAYGSPSEILPEDYEMPVSVAGRDTTMEAITRDAVEIVGKLATRKKTHRVVKKGSGRTGVLTPLKDFFFGISNTPVYHLARILEGGNEGVFSEILDKGIKFGERVQRAHSRKSTNMLNEGLEKAGITPKDLAKMSQVTNPRLKIDQWVRSEAATDLMKIDINGQLFQLSTGDLINFYKVSSEEDGVRHLLGGGYVIEGVHTGKLSEDTIANLRQRIENDPKAMAVIGIMSDIVENHWTPTINEVSNKLEGRDIATIPNWWGLEPWNSKKDIKGKESILPKTHRVNIIENKSILHDRVKSSIPLIMRDAFAEFSVYSEAIAEYVGMADPVRTATTLMNNPAITNELRKKGYGRVVDNIKTIHERAKSTPTKPGVFTKFLSQYMPNLYKAVLVLNSRVVVGQATSATNYTAYVSPQYLKGLKGMFSPKMAMLTMKLSDFAWDRFHMSHSSMMLGEIAESDAALKQWTGKTSDRNKASIGMKTSDLSALSGGMQCAFLEYDAAQQGTITGLSAEWWADKVDLPEANVEMYYRVEELGQEADPTEVEAVKIWKDLLVERSEYLWDRTQPAWSKWGRSILTSEREARGVFVLFRSFHEKSLTIFNDAKLDYATSDKSLDDKAKFVQRTSGVMAGYAVNKAIRILLLLAVTGKLDEPWQIVSEFVTSWMGMFPVFGEALELAVREFIAEATDTPVKYSGDPLQSFPVQIINVALKAPTDFASGMGNYIDGDVETAKEDIYKGTKKALESGAMLFYGVPVYEGKRFIPDSDDESATGRGKRSGQRRTSQSRSRRSRS